MAGEKSFLDELLGDPFFSADQSESQECELFGSFGIVMQIALGILSFSSLFGKRHFEYPKRSFRIFLLDISKQGASAGWCHVLNMMLAVYLQLKVNKGNGCEWYFINFICEIIFGVALTVVIHSVILHFAEKFEILVLQSGVYLSIHDAQYIYRYSYEDLDKHINYKVWGIQLLVWIIITTISKIFVFMLEYQYADYIIDIGINCLSVFKGHPQFELLFVMIMVPFTFNVMQYWIQDNFLKGTDFIMNQQKQNNQQRNEMSELHILQDGVIDFQKNRAYHRAQKGLDVNDPDDGELEKQIKEQEVEDEFVMVDKSGQKITSKVSDKEKKRKSHIIRQIMEGEMGIRKEDYDENGSLSVEKLNKRKSNAHVRSKD